MSTHFPRTFSLSPARQALKSRVLEIFSEQLANARPLDDEQVHQAVDLLASEEVPAIVKAEFLIALARKGETPAEIAAFVRALRGKSVPVPLDAGTRSREILDIVGTGGDRLGTFNISTTAAIICAAAGVTVAKHGNRAVTSQAGSADVLEALGIRIDLTPAEAARSLATKNFAFFFAPNFHPAFKHIGPARKLCAERGQRTIFNFLGPLLNPVHPSAMLMGVSNVELCEPLAHVLQFLGVRRGMVVSGTVKNEPDFAKPPSLDELSTLGDNTVAEFYHERGFTVSGLSLDGFPLQPARLADLLGGDKLHNAEVARRILHGVERGPKRDAALLNASAALFVAGQTKSIIEGWELAGKTIDDGKAGAKLEELAKE